MSDVTPDRERAVVEAALTRAGRIRVHRRHRRAAVAAAGALTAALAVVGALTLPDGRPTATLTVADPTSSPTSSPTSAPTSRATPTLAPSESPSAPASGSPSAGTARPATPGTTAAAAVDPLAGECVGPLPPGHRSVPECDARHPHAGPLPEEYCISDHNSCAWPDAWGADPGGPLDVSATGGTQAISVAWTLDDGDEIGPEPVHSFDLKLYRDGSSDAVREVLVPGASVRSTTLGDVPAGSWTVAVTAVNNAGRCSYYSSNVVTVAGPPSPSALPPESASASPSPESPSPTS